MIISLAVFALVETVMLRAGDVSARVESTQRARIAMDFITRQLRSQVCVLSTSPATVDPRAIVTGTPTSVTYFSDMADESHRTGNTIKAPELRSLSFESGKLIERVWVGVQGGSAFNPTYSYADYPLKPTRTRVLADELSTTKTTTSGGQPLVFRYYEFNAATPPKPEAEIVTGTGMSAAKASVVARIDVAFRANRSAREVHRPRVDPAREHDLCPQRGPEFHDPEAGVRMIATRLALRAERGFSMFLVIMAMLLTAMFIAAGFAAANGDLPISGVSKDRKITYAAAEAGLNFYLNHLQQDNDYWTKCDQVPAPNAAENNPVNQQIDPGQPDTRRWRNVPGSSSQYTIELLHTKNYTKCEIDPKKQDSIVDLATGTFKIRVTGAAHRDVDAAAQRRRDVPPQGVPELHLLHRLRDARPAGARQ